MKLHPLPLAVVITMFGVPVVFADPLIITGGSVSLASIGSGYQPPFGFTLTSDRTRIGGSTYDQTRDFLKIGDVVNLSRSVNLFSDPLRLGPFAQTVDGSQFTNVILRSTLRFVASPVTFTGDLSRGVQVPFTMEGVISLFQYDPYQNGALLFTGAIRGSGTGSLSMHPVADFFRVDFATYRFEPAAPTPAPEPSTLALFGSGLVVAVRQLRRTRRERVRPECAPMVRGEKETADRIDAAAD